MNTVALVGVGLMGGSLGLAARERAGVADVRGFSQTPATLELALERGAITKRLRKRGGGVRGRGADLRLHARAARGRGTCAGRSPPRARRPW